MRAWILTTVFVAAHAAAVGAQPTLRLGIEFDRSSWVAGEPVVAYVGVDNVGSGDGTVRFLPQPEFGWCRYVVSTAAGSRPFAPWAIKDATVAPATVKQGGRIGQPVKLFFGANGFTFPAAGEYTVEATCSGVSGSARAQVSVVAPRTPLEATQSRAILADRNVGFFLLFEGGDHLTSAKTLLEAVANSDTAFRPYANVVLGVSAAHDFAFISRGVLRKADPDVAKRYFGSVPDASLSSYYLLEKKRELAALSLAAGDAALAQRYRADIAAELLKPTLSPLVSEALRQAFSK